MSKRGNATVRALRCVAVWWGIMYNACHVIEKIRKTPC